MMWGVGKSENPEDQFERESRFHQLTGEKSPLHSKWPSKGGFEGKRLFSLVDLGGTMDHHSFSDLKSHQIFSHFQRP